MKPQPGQDAPDFSLEADDGSTVSRQSLLGERYVLYFYPKDDTTGCTAQACSMRDNFDRVTATGIRVFGVSPDSIKSHLRFREKYDLNFPLLSDPGHQVADAFGVWVDKTYMGRSYEGVERSSFIIGPNGKIEHVLERVKPMEHVDRIMGALAA
ncbi:MAG TPA: thioredoxin-dependent thiol peroxidase [Candidatus Limnocylindria bacterium]|jgi:peroxiredoxin Q/BCP|nr:thioredoxin-dependent thiol peroxidase [Candidatus Limnocylindria bacterium]